jgi:hypothetical protein
MATITEKPAAPAAPAPAAAGAGPTVHPLLRLWRAFKGLVVFLIVIFHLAVLAIRNPLDLWYQQISGWMKANPTDAETTWWDRYGQTAEGEFKVLRRADDLTWRYTNLVGLEQNWCMFSPSMARNAPFLAVRLEFADGSHETMYSANEPGDPSWYIRVGGWQVRKLEDYLLFPPDNLASHGERPLWEAYARYKLKQYQEARPGDPRPVKRIVFVRRRLYFPEPGQTLADVPPPDEKDIASFDARGKLLP